MLFPELINEAWSSTVGTAGPAGTGFVSTFLELPKYKIRKTTNKITAIMDTARAQ